MIDNVIDQPGLPSMVYKFFNKNFWGGIVKKDNISDKELAEESQKLFGKKITPFFKWHVSIILWSFSS